MRLRALLPDAIDARVRRRREDRLLFVGLLMALAVTGGSFIYMLFDWFRRLITGQQIEPLPFSALTALLFFTVPAGVAAAFVFRGLFRIEPSSVTWGARRPAADELRTCRETLEALGLASGIRIEVWAIDADGVNGFAVSGGPQKVVAVTTGLERCSRRAIEAICAALVARLLTNEESLRAFLNDAGSDFEYRHADRTPVLEADARALEVVREPVAFARGLAEALARPRAASVPLGVLPRILRWPSERPEELWLEALRIRQAYSFCTPGLLTSGERAWMGAMSVVDVRHGRNLATAPEIQYTADNGRRESILRHPGVIAYEREMAAGATPAVG